MSLGLEESVQEAGPREQEPLQLRRRDDDAAHHRLGDHIGAGRLARQERGLAEEVSRPERPAVLAVDADRGLTLEDHEEAAAAHPLPERALTLGEDLFVDRVRKSLELGAAEVREERQPRKAVDEVGAA